MKPKLNNCLSLAVISLAFLGMSGLSHAADQTYDPAGDDVWDLATLNWDASTAAWTNGNNAIFGGTGETVFVDDAIEVANMTFASDGYSIVPGFGTLDLAPGASTVNVVTGTAILNTPLFGGALEKAGAGTLVLGAANVFGGDTTISEGVLSVSAVNQTGTTGIVLDGGTLRSTGAANFDTNAITVAAGGGTIDSVHTAGTFRFQATDRLLGSGQLAITGNGTLPLAGVPFSGVVVFNSSNSYNGNIVVQDGGLMEYANAAGVAAGAAVTVNATGGLSTAGQNFIHPVTVNAGGTLAFQNNNNGIFSGPITVNGATTIRLQDWYAGTARNGAITSTITGGGPIAVNAGTGGGGTLTFRGFDAKASSSDISISTGSVLAVDSSAGSAAPSVARGGNLTLRNGNLTVTGAAGQDTNDIFGNLNIGRGFNTLTLAPNAAAHTSLTFAGMGSREMGSFVMLNKGSAPFGAVPAAGGANWYFATPPAGLDLIGGGGALGASNTSIIPWLRARGAADNNGIPTFYTYDPALGVTAVIGLVPFAGASPTDNTTGVGTLAAEKTVNSMIASGNVVMAGNTLHVTSGAIFNDVNLTFGSDAATPGVLDFGPAGAQLTSRNARTLTINSTITGSGGLTYVGTRSGSDPNLVLAGANTYTGTTAFYGYGGNTNVRLTNSLALQNTTLDHVPRGYNLTFGNGGTSGQTFYTFGGLSGTANLNLNNNNSTVAPVALTVGGNNESTTFSGVLSSTVAGGSLTKIGTGTLTLTGANSYTGATTVSAGILAVSGNSIADTGKLVIDGGKVAPSGVEVVGTLFLGGSQKGAGTWGSSSSLADNIDNDHFTGTGMVSVASGPAGYASWAAANGLTAGVNDGPYQDPDSDNIPNLLEYALGGLPIGPGSADTSILPAQTLDATNLTLTFERFDLSETDTTLVIQISSGLGGWTDFATVGPASAGAVTVTENSPTADLDTISVAIPRSNASNGKLFARLVVVKN